MRVRELLAANAFCLLAVCCVACARVEQHVGEYGERAPGLSPGTSRPDRSHDEQAGSASLPAPDPDPSLAIDPIMPSLPDGGPGALGPGLWLPPMLLDAGMSGSSDATSCTPMVLTAERRRLDMYIMLDSNITLPATGVWEKMTAGLGMFVSDSQSNGTGVGIRYFGLTCDAVDYANPSVDVDILPQNASAIMDSIRNRPPWSASPMLPALEGGVMHQRARARRYPEWKEIVVLVSDGFTQDVTCPYTTPDLADAAKEGLVGFPSIETYVIGLGATTSINQQFDELLTRLGAFNQIASAGGSTSAITTGITDGAPAFNAALQRVRRNALPCEYRAPAGVATSEFGVARFPARDVLTRFKNESDCGDSQGWYYAIESLPTPVTMCPATCEWLRESDERQVGIWMGCPTATR